MVGTANSATDHHVYIWDMHGHLINILGQGEKVSDGALHFACHPTRPILATCAKSGAVYVWTKRYSENWSAFAPDFKELEENIEYVEREDEFDEVDALFTATDARGQSLPPMGQRRDNVMGSFVHLIDRQDSAA